MAGGTEYLLEPLREGGDFILYRGRNQGKPAPILVLAVSAERPSPDSLRQLDHEHSLQTELDETWSAQPVALTRHQGRAALILKDPGGELLDRLIAHSQGQGMELSRFLRISIGLAVRRRRAPS